MIKKRYKTIPIKPETARKLEVMKMVYKTKSYDVLINQLIAARKAKKVRSRKLFELLDLR